VFDPGSFSPEAGMENPRLRPIEVLPFQKDGETLLLLRDPTQISRATLLVSPGLLPILRALDGDHSVLDVQASLTRAAGRLVYREEIERVLAKLDEALLLDSARFRAERLAMERAFREAPVRAPAHAGSAYPAEAAAFRAELEPRLRAAAAPEGIDGEPAGILSPHIDYGRGIETYVRAWAGVRLDRFDRAVILGTSHHGDALWATTAKGFATPFGRLPADRDFLEALGRRHGGDLRAGEFAHRDEHSVELNAVLLHHLAGRDLPIVPVLCGSFHELVAAGASPAAAPAAARFPDALAETIAASSGRTLLVAAADLSHVGPRFGDPSGLDAPALEALARDDRASLERAAAGDAEGFYRSIAGEGDRRKVCGLPPIWALLRALGGSPGRLLDYRQCPDPYPGSYVSIAAMRFGS
jgi:hypothetical protein